MRDRLELQLLLEETLGSSNVYFQPPSKTKMRYPAIVYSRIDINNKFADDEVYLQHRQYKITVIDSDPDSLIVTKVSRLPSCRFNQHYETSGLNHDVFTIFF